MNSPVFRPVEFWKHAITTMQDNSFFELMRSVFGKIKTPFNKQQLVNDLEGFLLREDIQNTISCYIDVSDAKVIAAVAALNEPAPGELESFFSGELSYAQLHDTIVNLEERFILYRFRTEGHSSGPGLLALNPVLEQVLSPFAQNHSLLLPAVSEDEISKDGEPPPEIKERPLNDRILAALLSFVSQEELFFKAEREIRKRIIETGKIIFPGMDLETVLGALQTIGLLYADGDRLIPDYKRFFDFAGLSPRQRMEVCAAGIMCYDCAESSFGILPPLVRGKILFLSDFISVFLDSLEPDLLYSENILKRLAAILLRERKTDMPETASAHETINSRLIDALKKTGLIAFVCRIEGHEQFKRPGTDTISNDNTEKYPVIASDSDFSFLIYPEITYSDAIELAAVINVREAGHTVRFEMTRDSAIHAFDRNISAARIIDLLKKLSDNRISETLTWTLTEWEKRYGEVSLGRELVLNLSEDRRYLARTKSLAALIRETPAPGLYLLNEDAENRAIQALRAAGIDIIARRKAGYSNTGDEKAKNSFTLFSDSGHSAHSGPEKMPKIKSAPVQEIPGNATTLIEGFHAILKEMPLGKAERDELAARINRRLILSESQLRDSSIRYEKLEGRLLDYNGKLNIAKQALSMKSPVEIVWQNNMQETRIFGLLSAVEKDANENVLVISPAGTQESLRIPLGRISLLRRIKKSIFEL
ncbi:MAG: helicase-associated domain-containing protein [Treponema sp.]|nr:helicase-associated domain-containing protein [Treponema sp.]